MMQRTIVEAKTMIRPVRQETTTAVIVGTPDFDAYVAVGVSAGGVGVGISVAV